ncbi:MAG: HAMP domain-containing sensor histidine kinase [Rhodospirillaceae bacterium]
MLERIPIRIKLALGFALVIGLAATNGLVATTKVMTVGNFAADLYAKPLQSMDSGRLAQSGFREVVTDQRLSSHSDSQIASQARYDYARARAELTAELRVAAHRAGSPEMADHVAQAVGLLKRWDALIPAGIATTGMDATIATLSQTIQETIDLAVEDAKTDGFYMVQQTRDLAMDARTVTLTVSVIAVLSAMLCALLLARDISRPLRTAVAMAEMVAAGHLEDALPETRRTDEIGKLLRAMDTMRVRLRDRLAADRRNAEMLASSRERAEKALSELQATQSQLVEAEKMASLGGLVAGVAHEINTPVGNALGAASHLARRTREAGELFANNRLKKSDAEAFLQTAADASGIIETNIGRAAELIQSFKQVAADQTSDQRRRFGLARYLDEIILSLKPRIKKTPHALIVCCPPEIEADTFAGALAQVVSNLVVNALFHAFERETVGTITITVAVPEASSENMIEMQVGDNGCGIPTENLKRIFEPFFTTKRGVGGTGLGLHIVYNLMTQRLGGTISVGSTVGAGSVFTLRFPRIAGSGQVA